MALIPRLLSLPRGSAFLLGPRGTGTTTWLRSRFPDALVVDLLDPEEHRRLSARPERLRDRVRAAADRFDSTGGLTDVVVDEVQRVPELLSVVHGMIESDPQIRLASVPSATSTPKRGGSCSTGESTAR